MNEYEVQRCTRHCAITGRELRAGEVFYSTLVRQGAQLVRRDYCAEVWSGPPQEIVGWWQARMPEREARRHNWAPNEVMLELLQDLEATDTQQELRYVLALLLARRRVIRLEGSEHNAQGREVSVYYCPRRESTLRVVTAVPDESRTSEIQQELSKLLFADAK